jgi:hypothetical protein
MTNPDFERLAKLVHARRTELRLGIEPASKAGGISKDTWKRVEAGQKVWDRSFAGIEAALQWEPGSCRRIIEGGDPVPAGIQPNTQPPTVTQIPKDELKRLVGDAVQSAAIATKGSMTGDEILALNERVIQELRERGVL